MKTIKRMMFLLKHCIQFLAVSALVTTPFFSFSQKVIIDEEAINNWQSVSNPELNANGRYAFYSIENWPAGHTSLIIKATEGAWSKTFVDASNAEFSDDNVHIVFKKGNDSLCVLKLGTDSIRIVSDVSLFEFDGESLFVYRLNKQQNKIVVENYSSGIKKSFDSVKNYELIPRSKMLLLYTNYGDSNALKKVDLTNFKEDLIWSSTNGSSIERYQVHKNGDQIAIIVKAKRGNEYENQLWYYRTEMKNATILVNSDTPGFDSSYSIWKYLLSFSGKGTWIFFYCQKKKTMTKVASLPPVDVWSYKDKMLQSVQLKNTNPQRFQFTVNCQGDSVMRLEHENEQATWTNIEDYIILTDNVFGPPFSVDAWQNNKVPKNYYLLNLVTGKKVFLTNAKDPGFNYAGNGKVVFFDRNVKQYFCYDVNTERKKNITAGIPTKLSFQSSDIGDKNLRNEIGVAAIINEDTSVLIYDNYDIWKVSLVGTKAPLCITGRFGSKNHMKFRLTYESENERSPMKIGNSLLLTAFNTLTKENGFYLCSPGKDLNISKLIMENSCIYRTQAQSSGSGVELNLNYPFKPIKAKEANVFIVRKMTSEHSPNYFLTDDFKNYKSLSEVYPERKYNWLTTTLISYKTDAGTANQGILYKPQNFDSNKKYPLILYYYEQMSDRLNDFAKPEFIKGDLNIPWFVSRGYLIFTPDIRYTIGQPGKSALDCIESAAKYLSKLSYVDANKIALQGHSFGGFETNYVVTHSQLFAAAVAGAGPTDFVSGYGSLFNLGSQQDMFETGQLRIQHTLWERPDLYFDNSAVLKANEVTTPLLMMHNKDDGNVPWQQGIELFTALRRLEKRVWLLQYDGERHVFYGDSKADKDYTIRMTQFFDHYLKSAPAPIWMTQGIPARLKQIESGYALDPAGSCGKDCKVCKMWNEKWKKDSVATMKEIQEKTKTEHWMGGGE